MFTDNGHYAYDGLWQSTDHYIVRNRAVTILLDSSLEREFVITKRNGVLYLEDTAGVCS